MSSDGRAFDADHVMLLLGLHPYSPILTLGTPPQLVSFGIQSTEPKSIRKLALT
jgi:hypothetical protein